MNELKELHTAHRPKSWKEVVGHKEVVRTLQSTLSSGTSRAFLFTGPPGVGKTTFARLIARHLGINPETDRGNYIEHDGATNTGVDDMREILHAAQLNPFGSKPEKVFVIDEAHMLSKAAWNSALKAVEEPPPGVFWVFCTSEGTKVPAAIRSRCQEFVLSEVSNNALEKLLQRVAKEEGLSLEDDVLDLIVDHASGSPRAALVAYGKVLDMPIEEAEPVLAGVASRAKPEVFEFCRALSRGVPVGELCKLIGKLEGVTAEGVRIMVCNYFTKVAYSGKKMESTLAVLEAFGEPYPAGIGPAMYPVLVSLGRLCG